MATPVNIKHYLNTPAVQGEMKDEVPEANTLIIPDGSCGPGMTPASQTYWRAKAWELKEGELEKVRTSAGTWRATISSLAGIAAIVTILTGREDIKKLDSSEDWIASLSREASANALLLLALAAVVAAIYFVSRAELGPMKKFAGSPNAVCNYVNEEPGRATSDIKTSQGLTFISVALLIAAIFLIGYGKQDPGAAQNYLAIPASGTAVCGSLETAEDGTVAITPKGSDTAIVLTDITELNEVTSCGAA